MDGLDDFLFFNAIEDEREENERGNDSSNDSSGSSWDGESDDNEE